MKTAADIMAEMRAITDPAEAAGEALTDEQVTAYESLEAELHGVNKTAELFSRQKAYETPITGFPAVIKATPKADEALDFAFNAYLRTGQPNSEIAQLFAQTEGTSAAGGYTVPTGFRQKLTERLVAFGGLRAEAETIDTGNGITLPWPTVDDTSSTRADIAAEGAATAAGADITFGTKQLGAYKYTSAGTSNLPVKVSIELLQDSAFDVAAFISRALGTRIARKQAKDLMTGSGSGQPLGLLFGSGGGDVKLAGGGAITYAKLNALLHKLDPAYRPGAKWLFNDNTAALIEAIVDSTGRPILVPTTQGVQGAVNAGNSLLGYPVVIDQGAPDEANLALCAAFGNFREAYIVRNVLDVQVLVNPYEAVGYVTYHAWARMDGTIQNRNAMATLEGTT